MVTRRSKLAVLVMLCTVGIGSSTRVVAQPDQNGQWGSILSWPLEAIHMILLKNGKVLCVYDRVGVSNLFMVFDPVMGDTTVITSRPLDQNGFPFRVFCSGHSQLPDGMVVFVGGGLGYISSHNHTVIFDPDAASTACTLDTECTAFTGKCNVNDGFCVPWIDADEMPDVVPPVGPQSVFAWENRFAIAWATW